MKLKKVMAGVLAATMIMGSSVYSFAAGSAGPEPEPVITPAPETPVVPPVGPAAPVAPTAPTAPGRVTAPTRGTTTTTTTAPAVPKQLYKTSSDIKETDAYKKLLETSPEIAAVIDAVNAGQVDLPALADALTDPELKAKLAGKDFVTPFFDVEWTDGDTEDEKNSIKNAEGEYVIDLSIPALTENLTGVQGLHYSTERNEFEVVDPKALNLKDKTVSMGLKDFSPVAIIADTESIGK